MLAVVCLFLLFIPAEFVCVVIRTASGMEVKIKMGPLTEEEFDNLSCRLFGQWQQQQQGPTPKYTIVSTGQEPIKTHPYIKSSNLIGEMFDIYKHDECREDIMNSGEIFERFYKEGKCEQEESKHKTRSLKL